MTKQLLNLKLVVPLLIFILVMLFFWNGIHRNPHRLASPLINHEVPEFTAQSLIDPSRQVTQAIFKGHPTVLNVFATWCGVCRVEHPWLVDFHNQDGIHIVGLDYKDDGPKALEWLKDFGNPYDDVIFDPKGIIAINLGVYGTPEYFLIDSKGIIRDKYVGAIMPAQWPHIRAELLSYEPKAYC
jgi:cytochrome c biogenesis protein CcmG/thiol:disulfide interchange protein DsbE